MLFPLSFQIFKLSPFSEMKDICFLFLSNNLPSTVVVTTKRQISLFSLSKDDLFPLFWVVISENGKIIWRLVVTSTIWWMAEDFHIVWQPGTCCWRAFIFCEKHKQCAVYFLNFLFILVPICSYSPRQYCLHCFFVMFTNVIIDRDFTKEIEGF